MANNTQNYKDRPAINADLEPYHRRWNGGSFHMHSNRLGGAFGWSKKEWHRMIEERNRINKQRKLKQKGK
jgi:hypothetical protein